jgi:hypothetical protein
MSQTSETLIPGNKAAFGCVAGIQTCLAAMRATSHPAWAALSTSGLRTLDLPKDVRDVIVLADGDDLARRQRVTAHGGGTGRGAECASLGRLKGMDFHRLLRNRMRLDCGPRTSPPSMDTMNNVFLFREQSHPRTGSLMLSNARRERGIVSLGSFQVNCVL